jgi:hypothetical protein
MGERGFGADPAGVVAGAGQELAGDLGANTGKGEQVWRDLADQLGDFVIGIADLLAQLLVASGESAQGGLGGLFGVAELVAGTQPSAAGDDLVSG